MKQTFKQTIAIIGTLAYLLIGIFAFAQAPQKFNYQGIARDAKGNPMSKQTLALKLSVLPTSDATVPEYEETQLVTTNEFGLYTLQIGNGTAVTGEMKTVKWETGNKYIKVAIDPTGGTNYVDAGTNQLLSVPYALYADKAGEAREGAGSTIKATRATNNYIEKTNGAGVANSTSLLYDNGSNIGMGTTAPAAKFHMNGTGTNELRIQSAGGSPRLSFFGDAATGFTSTANYALMYKRPATDVGNFSTGFANAKLFIFGNAQGSLLFNTGGNVGFGYFNQAANTTTTNLFVEGTTGNTGIGTAEPGAKLEVNSAISANTSNDGIVNIGQGATTNHLTLDNNEVQAKTGVAGYTTLYQNFWGGNIDINNNFFNSTGLTGIGNINADYKLNVDPGTANGLGGINIADALDDYSLYSSKSGINEAIFLEKTSLSTGTPVLTLSSASTSAAALNITSGGLGGTIYANNGNGLNINSYHGTSSLGTAIRAYSDSLSAGYFYSNGTGTALNSGVLRAEYTGTTVADRVGIYGKSVPNTTSNYGIGIKGEGGYKGVEGIVNNAITATVYGLDATVYNNSFAYGVYGQAGNHSLSGTGTKYGVYGSASGGATNWAGYFSGNVNITGSIAKGSGTFKIDHPLDPENKYLYHSFVESPDMMNIYNGNIATDANGDATITMPDYFNALNTDFRYQLTAVGSFAQLMVSEKMNGNTFKIKSNTPNVEVSWLVTGVRQDKYANQNRVKVEVEKTGEEKGKYLHPTAFGLPESMGIDQTRQEEKRLKDAASKDTFITPAAPAKEDQEKSRYENGVKPSEKKFDQKEQLEKTKKEQGLIK